MKKILTISIILAVLAFASCGRAKTKADEPDTLPKTSADTVLEKPEVKPPKNGTARSIEPGSSPGNHDKNKILANIDQYLVSTAAYPDPGTVVIKNTLPDVSVQKAIIEVRILNANGAEARIDYYIVNNIEPGDSKTVKIASAAAGVSASCHVVKLKSKELTGEETIMVGSKYVPK